MLFLLRSLDIPQHRSNRPHETLLHLIRLPLFNRNKVLDKRHACVRTNPGQDMPPAMQLKRESPRHTERAAKMRYVIAEMDVYVPKKVAEETRT
jgi:hypothetical protein